ncbi:mandelate racemase/muconate lactonizing enzyme family protein [Ancylobacter mangrovi]|uniref:mandelate racemase/muconate lactonizing enzyme family protein n=1 Tax=Ancylobacter mangrovi TaxID=2972472 RepID=UPI002162A57E|nr:mandelate racemase/muconate lactonizing enzyme family protein [Ancylobacter mangrovi]MCS0502044.1 mandelate racemase/muconate lactonizing enzyme family protein [Ancylobacter mangrovi]
MHIRSIEAFPLSARLPENARVTLGIGTTVKRDTVLVKVTTDDGLTGYGEAHHGRAPGAIANLVNSTLRELVTGHDVNDVVGIWQRIYLLQLASHGMGAAAAIAMSGIDMALWDIRGKAVGLPLHALLGGARRPAKAYAGGIALGYQPPESLADEAQALVARGYRAMKLRIGDTPANDMARVTAVRERVGPEVDILTDANANATVEHVRAIMPCLDANRVGWLEEPFAPHDYRRYRTAAGFGSTPLAAGENHYTRFEFVRLIEDGAVTYLQPDLSKAGGITEALRIAGLASAWKLSINPHCSATSLNMAATLHFLGAIDNPGYFEAEVAEFNPFRDTLCSSPYVFADGMARAPEGPGLGVEVDESCIARFPLIDGPGYVK